MFNNSTPFTMPVTPAYTGNGGGFGGFGDDWVGLIIILALLGWGGNGIGGFGGGFGGNRGGYEPCATQADVRAAVDQQTLISKLDQQTYGLADSTYALNNAITNGFHGVDNAICTLGYQNQQGFNTLAHQLADCCCTTQRAIDGINYNMATQACDTRNVIQNSTRDILESNNSNTRAILDFLLQSKMDEKDGKIAELQSELMLSRQNAFFTANQDAQTAELIRRMGRDFPVNAVVVQPNTPVTFPTNCCGNVSYANFGGGCGCA